MARCVVKEEKGLEIAFGEAFENVDCRIDLREEIFGAEIAITILASLEDNPGLPEDKLAKRKGKHGDGRTHRHHASGPTRTSRSPRP
jgi:hypothetical protein